MNCMIKTIYRCEDEISLTVRVWRCNRLIVPVRPLRTASPQPADQEFAPYGLFRTLLLLMMMVGVNTTWGQVTPSGPDYSGYYYIANFTTTKDKEKGYNVSTPENNFYLCPAKPAPNADENYNYDAIYYDGNSKQQPYLTTYRTGRVEAAMWKVEFKETISGVDYYYIRYCADNNKYLTHNTSKAAKGTRFTVHLQADAGTDNESLFCFETTDDESFNIRPQKVSDGSRHINPANGNQNSYYGINGATTTINGNTVNPGGMVGYWSATGADGYASRWYLERVQPTISYNSADHKIEISNIDEDVTIYYTDDGITEPTTEQTEKTGTNPIVIPDVNNSVSIKAIAAKSGVLPSLVSEIRVVPSATITFGSSSIIYNSSEQKPAVTVKDGDTTIPSSEYEVGYSNNVNASDAALVTVTNATGGDYIVYGSTTFTILPAEVTLTANSGTEPYDGTEKTVTGFTSSVDGLTFEGVSASGSGTNIGEYDVTFTGVTIDTTKDTSGNYVVTGTTNGKLTITPRPLTITADSDTKVYDGTALTKDSYTNTELLAGDHIESVTVTGSQTVAGTSNNVPSAAVIKNSANDNITANYGITYTNGTLEVTKKTLTIIADAKSKAYGEADPALTYTSEGLINDDAISGTLTRDAGEDAGDYAITQGGLTAGNNYAISYTGANLTITKVPLTVTANNNTITYGNAPVGNGVTCEGFVNSETVSVLGGTLDYDYSYSQYGDVGNTYTITPKGLTSNNYDISFVAGTLIVNPKEVGITWGNTVFSYDGEEHAPTATVTGLVNSDEIGVTVSGGQTNAGSHTATASALTGDKKDNYQLPDANTQSFTISPKSIGGGTLADGYTLGFGEGNTILLTDDIIGCALVIDTDYNVSDDRNASPKYSERTVTGKGNYTGYFDVRNVVVSFTTDTDQEEWSATFAAEKEDESDIGLALPDGVSAFIISGIEDEWAIPEPLKYIPEGVPVLLVAHKQINGFVVTKANSEDEGMALITSDQIDKNMLEEVTADTPGYDAVSESAPFTTKQIYLLYKNEFVFNKAGNLKKGKVYLNPNHTTSSPAPARLRIAWNNTTGIQEAKNGSIVKTLDDIWYTIDGRRLSGKPNVKGLYIYNGNKVVIK